MRRRRTRIARSRTPWWQRLLLDRAALRYWAAVLALAAVLAGVVGRTTRSAADAQASWGQTRAVLVAAHPLGAGDELTTASTRVVRWPRGLVPDAALHALPEGSRARAPTDAGAPLTEATVQDEREARRAEWRTIAVPTDERSLPVEAGDEVDLWSVPDASLVADGSPPARRVATGAEVVAVADTSVVLAVAPSQVTAVTAAVGATSTVLVGTP